MEKNLHSNIEKDIQIFCRNIKALRAAKKLSKREMAQRLRISVSSLTRLESGVLPKKLSCTILFTIYNTFGITPGEICSEDFSPKQQKPTR